MQSTESSRDELIDVLRGLAIAGVISFHVAQTTLQGGGVVQSLFLKVFSLGKYGVELFFIVSGFLIFKLYGRNFFKLCINNSPFSNIGFFLFPIAYTFTLLISLVLAVPSMKFIEKPIMNLSR